MYTHAPLANNVHGLDTLRCGPSNKSLTSTSTRHAADTRTSLAQQSCNILLSQWTIEIEAVVDDRRNNYEKYSQTQGDFVIDSYFRLWCTKEPTLRSQVRKNPAARILGLFVDDGEGECKVGLCMRFEIDVALRAAANRCVVNWIEDLSLNLPEAD